MNTYICAFDTDTSNFTNDQLLSFIRSNRYVTSWYQPFSGVILIKTDDKGSILFNSLDDFIGKTHFFMSQISSYDLSGGLLPAQAWEWLADKPMAALNAPETK